MHSTTDTPPRDWHARPAAAVLAALDTHAGGLSDAEAHRRLAQTGPNALPAAARRPAWRRLLTQFHNVLIYLLLVAGLAAALLGHPVDAAVIFGVVVVNALIGFVQEGKAERAMEAIGRMLAPQARVSRDGRRRLVDAEALVPGDIVLLKAGDRVPADLRLFESHGLRIDEAALTGESAPVAKRTQEVPADAPLAERSGMAYAGTMVVGGQGVGVVVATAFRTQLGRISHLLGRVRTLTTPLLREIDRFARWLSAAIIAVAVAMVTLSWILHDLPPGEGFMAGVALAVAAIPEGLPAIITITLAVGVQRMARRQAVIRRLPAVETLGAVSVICTDKTGTLTRNELVATQLALAAGSVPADAAGEAARGLLEAAVLCNEAASVDEGDPLERALLRMAEGAGLDAAALRADRPRLTLLPFSSEAKFMATRHAGRICLKGAPETVLARCDRQREGSDDAPLDTAYWQARLDAMAREGMRVLALAERIPSADESADSLSPEQVDAGLSLLGLVAFIDPPRPEVPAAIAACRSAGIAVKMITGDHVATAAAIARQLDIAGEAGPLTGPEIDRLDDAELAARVGTVNVYARTTPEHKLRLVTALQAQGRVVAMTGDGANDAPALKRADIGVAMGIKGTEAARQAAEIVLADDNFASIVAGIEEGRGVHDNIRKALMFILPTNAAEALVVLIAAVAGMALPITPVQILWINMATAVTLAMALAFEPLERGIMRRPPRSPRRGLVTRYVAWRIAWVGLLLTAGVFWLFEYVLASTGSEALARSVALNALIAGEAVYLFNCRRWLAPAWTRDALFANGWAWLSIVALVAMQAAVTYWPPAQAVFGTQALTPREWGWIVGLAATLFVAVELEKGWLRSRR